MRARRFPREQRSAIAAAVEAVKVDVRGKPLKPFRSPLDLGHARKEGKQAALTLG